MFRWIVRKWSASTLNEKLMYGLILAFVIGIALRWDFIAGELSETLSNMFSPTESPEN